MLTQAMYQNDEFSVILYFRGRLSSCCGDKQQAYDEVSVMDNVDIVKIANGSKETEAMLSSATEV